MNLFEKIPNNVNLSENKRLQRALERWQPNYLKWWSDAGPADFQADNIYLRTAISVDAKGSSGSTRGTLRSPTTWTRASSRARHPASLR